MLNGAIGEIKQRLDTHFCSSASLRFLLKRFYDTLVYNLNLNMNNTTNDNKTKFLMGFVFQTCSHFGYSTSYYNNEIEKEANECLEMNAWVSFDRIKMTSRII